MNTNSPPVNINKTWSILKSPTNWHEASRGFLVRNNGNKIEVKMLTQSCVFRWISHFFQFFGLDLSVKLSSHKPLLSKVYTHSTTTEEEYKKLITLFKSSTFETILEISNNLISKPIQDEPQKSNVESKKDTPTEKKPDLSKPVFDLSLEEVEHELHQYTGKKAEKTDITGRLHKNALFNRRQQLEEANAGQKAGFVANLAQPAPYAPESAKTEQSHSAASTAAGRRGYQQDAFLLAPQTEIYVGGSTVKADVYGVFDGHGKKGEKAANYIKEHFIKKFNSISKKFDSQTEEEQLFSTCKETMQELHKDYLLSKDHGSGTTAVMAMVIKGYVWILNVGDSRAILVNKNGVVCQASTDAKPADPRFLKKAQKRGGSLIHYGVPRISYGDGYLATPRSIGDDSNPDNPAPIIAPNPKISRYPLEQFEGGHIVLACDGIWDVATSDRVGAAVYEATKKDTLLGDIATQVVNKAYNAGSQDNLTVVVAQLPPMKHS